jgi:hypothetical protein
LCRGSMGWTGPDRALLLQPEIVTWLVGAARSRPACRAATVDDPVMLVLAGLPRNTTAAATSSGTLSRADGVRSRTYSRTSSGNLAKLSSVTVNPGATTLVRMPGSAPPT